MQKPKAHKIFQCERWEEFSGTFPTSGTMFDGKLSPLPQQEHPTEEIESSSSPLLPTPTVGNAEGGNLTRSGARSNELLLPGVAVAAMTGALLPTPAASDGTGGGADPQRRLDQKHTLQIIDVATAYGTPFWAKYEPAIQRWEGLTRPAPAPAKLTKNGKYQLTVEFDEWLMGWPEGWVSDLVNEGEISRRAGLKACGNGVVPQQAAQALRELLDLTETDLTDTVEGAA